MKPLLYVGIFVSLLLLYACYGSQHTESKNEQNISLKIKDSVSVDIFADPLLAGVSKRGYRILFLNWASEEYITINREGEILGRFSKNEDVPDNPGFLFRLPGLRNSKEVVLYGMNGIFYFDIKGKLIRKQKSPAPSNAGIMAGLIGRNIKFTQANGEEFMLFNTLRNFDSYPGEEEYYEKFKGIELVQIGKDISYNLGQIPDSSIFRAGKAYFSSDYDPVAHLENQKFYLAFAGEPILYQYSLNADFSLSPDTAINLDVKMHLPIEGFPLNEFNKGSVTFRGDISAIRQIEILGKNIIINYSPGIPQEEVEEVKEQYPDDFQLGYRKLREKYHSQILILDKITHQQLANLKFPENASTEGFIVNDEGLWFQRKENFEKEEDFVRFYLYRLVKY
ncbi:hypothetical protein [Marivirga sp.]|uniref:hypothetical protein n=1 Tax=Marivirga sp. TaxID=2018662 RepID=UPI0025E8282E|nr:hypothetical protein [Marivirga sp.]